MIIVWAINESSWLDLQELNFIMSGQMSMFQWHDETLAIQWVQAGKTC